MVAKDKNGKSVPVPGLILEGEQGIRRFARSKIRKEQVFKRDTRFDEATFIPKEHLGAIERRKR